MKKVVLLIAGLVVCPSNAKISFENLKNNVMNKITQAGNKIAGTGVLGATFVKLVEETGAVGKEIAQQQVISRFKTQILPATQQKIQQLQDRIKMLYTQYFNSLLGQLRDTAAQQLLSQLTTIKATMDTAQNNIDILNNKIQTLQYNIENEYARLQTATELEKATIEMNVRNYEQQLQIQLTQQQQYTNQLNQLFIQQQTVLANLQTQVRSVSGNAYDAILGTLINLNSALSNLNNLKSNIQVFGTNMARGIYSTTTQLANAIRELSIPETAQIVATCCTGTQFEAETKQVAAILNEWQDPQKLMASYMATAWRNQLNNISTTCGTAAGSAAAVGSATSAGSAQQPAHPRTEMNMAGTSGR